MQLLSCNAVYVLGENVLQLYMHVNVLSLCATAFHRYDPKPHVLLHHEASLSGVEGEALHLQRH